MRSCEVRGEVKVVALRVIGRRVAQRLGVEDIEAMQDTAVRLYNKGNCRGLSMWEDVASRIEELLEQAVKEGTVQRANRGKKANWSVIGKDGWHRAPHQDDDGFWKHHS